MRRCALSGLVIWIGVRLAMLMLGAAAAMPPGNLLVLTPPGSLAALLLVAVLLTIDLAAMRDFVFHANFGVGRGPAVAAGLLLPGLCEAMIHAFLG
ncbi:MAG: hypothetical protein WEB88_18060 [Gemmatimonadota bacterium]